MSVEVQKRKISGEFVAKVCIHSGMLFIVIPKRFAEFKDIRINDLVRVAILEVRRERAKVEGEAIEEEQVSGAERDEQ
jgi:hypothetical protein